MQYVYVHECLQESDWKLMRIVKKEMWMYVHIYTFSNLVTVSLEN